MAVTEAPASGDKVAAFEDFAHTGPGTLAGRYLRRHWQPVYVASELPPGHAVPVRVMSEDFTLYRGEDGVPHVVAPRCAHRGTQLSTGWVEGDCVRCFYHGWKYDGAGQCVEMPAEDASFPPKVKIASYPCEEYLGLIFAYLGEGEAPPLPRMVGFEESGFCEAEAYTRDCNYFQNIENGVDSVHVAFVHRVSDAPPVIPRQESEEAEYGLLHRAIRPEGAVRTQFLLMPNALLIKLPPQEPFETDWRDHLAWRVPIDDERHFSFLVVHIHGEGEAARQYQARPRQSAGEADVRAVERAAAQAIMRGELRLADLASGAGVGAASDALVRWENGLVQGGAARAGAVERARLAGNIVWVQDEVAQVGQGPIADRTDERLGRSDVAIIRLRQVWARELRALAEGRPLKRWVLPPHLVGTPGRLG